MKEFFQQQTPAIRRALYDAARPAKQERLRAMVEDPNELPLHPPTRHLSFRAVWQNVCSLGEPYIHRIWDAATTEERHNMFLASTTSQRLRLISWSQAPDATPTAATLLTALPEPQLPAHIEIREELYRLYLSCHSERKRTRQSRSAASTSSPTAVHPPGNDLATSTTTEATSHNYLEGARVGEAQNPGPPLQQSSNHSTYLGCRRHKRRTSPGSRLEARQAPRQPPHRTRQQPVTSTTPARRPPTTEQRPPGTPPTRMPSSMGAPPTARQPCMTAPPAARPPCLPTLATPQAGGTARQRDPPPRGQRLGSRLTLTHGPSSLTTIFLCPKCKTHSIFGARSRAQVSPDGGPLHCQQHLQ